MATKKAGEAGANIRLDDDDTKTHSPHITPALSRCSSSSSNTSYNMAHAPISVIQEAGSDLFEERSHVQYLKPFEEEILKMVFPLALTPAVSPISPPYSDEDSSIIKDKLEFVEKKHKPFITTPPEIVMGIFKYLNPIDAVCFSLLNKYIRNVYLSHGRHQILDFNPPLAMGRPESTFPVIPGPQRSCRHCCPVAFFPAHCELHFHLASFMPSHLTFCAGQCQMFTEREESDPNYCGSCGRNYRKQFERGRRMIDVKREDGHTFKWYEQPRFDRESRARQERRAARRAQQVPSSNSL
ncbi:uncharacterized protein EAE98_010421 [Botrytis deweyae]|uniref:F-box domain-containing protein n=2 Tax=Botrytis TaxID=33196 RepID=A0A4Z1JE72_9HELO|nr:uncharacterized protein EAE98_010421 [Botrytis deweyae]KAF7916990.1 hypothetical protein EAE98_010421 [Botrytis deweyae]KAF7927220.1 hypothetical protein EAE99_005551 [Botrytis elliptica]TGO69810.1 hypothetical protein BELL_0753g00050 [Botrytis elliptica]